MSSLHFPRVRHQARWGYKRTEYDDIYFAQASKETAFLVDFGELAVAKPELSGVFQDFSDGLNLSELLDSFQRCGRRCEAKLRSLTLTLPVEVFLEYPMTSQPTNQALKPLNDHFKRLASTYGVEVDFDHLSETERAQFFANIPGHVADAKVIIVRNANLDRGQLYQLGQALGTPLKYAFSGGVEGYPELIEIRRTPNQATALSTMWHSDSTYLVVPPDVTLLYGVEIPPYGGTTLFADTAAAFLDLTPTMRDVLRKLRVVQRSDVHANNERLAHLSKPADRGTALGAVHDAIKKSDGVEAIYVSQEHSSHFDGMSHEESRPLIEFLTRHIAADKYRLEIAWKPNTLVILDNRKTLHRAIDNYFGHSRTLLRLILQLKTRCAEQRHDEPQLMAAE